MSLLANLSNDGDRRHFLEWIRHTVLDEVPADFGFDSDVIDGRTRLRKIAEYTRQFVPTQDAILCSESVHSPVVENGSVETKVFCSLDSFLFDEEDEEKMVAEGQLARSYCRDCGSRKIDEIEFVTHSCSREQLEFIFRSLLPSLRGKTVLDVGSRFGAVLYGAYYFSESAKIIGIEMNPDLCRLQKQVAEQFSLSDRISIVEAEMTSRPDLMASADVVILNNVWEWFVPTVEGRVTMWEFVRQHLKPGALLVTVPDLETSLRKLGIPTGLLLTQWVRELNPTHPERTSPSALEEESTEVKLYQVLD